VVEFAIWTKLADAVTRIEGADRFSLLEAKKGGEKVVSI
jgi:hypothetical protein